MKLPAALQAPPKRTGLKGPPTESGATTVEAAVMAVEEQAPVGFESKNKRTVFIGSSMTKKGTPQRRYADYDSEEIAKESETAQR